MDKKTATKLALGNRLDLRVAEGKVYDAQRDVVIAADNLRAELTLLGSASMGASRTVATATSGDAKLRTNRAKYAGLLTLDLPMERTAERNAYRNSFIALEKIIRDFQKLEDTIKLSVRNELRDLLQSRESLAIQTKSVFVAEKRVKSINMFLEAGRAEIRDLLEAEESLLSAQNQLTAAVVNYRIAELQIQRDMGVLMVDSKGLWKEFSPEK
jgi:outer membrane protein TolC